MSIRQSKVISSFEEKWGITIGELAESEDTTFEAIHMRVHNFGTPFQRRAKPTYFERKYSKTLAEIAIEKDAHPNTIYQKEKIVGHIDFDVDTHFNGTRSSTGIEWQKLKKHRVKPWLHPSHPDYESWRACTLFKD